MKIKKFFIIFPLMLLILVAPLAFASITNGTIDSTYHYAWGENIGWVDFANITITDSGLSGSAYGENIGWIDLSTITNTNAGVLSGYAWGENIGWVDFSQVSIGTDGVFTGNAYGENIGWITFGTGDNKVETDWRPLSARPHQSTTSSGGYMPGYGPKFTTTPTPIVPIVSPTTPPTTTPLTFTFTKNLKLGQTDPDVKQLQIFLNAHNFLVSTSGAGSARNETNYFGKLTKQAIAHFQKENKLPAVGMLGPLTRGIINKLLLNN